MEDWQELLAKHHEIIILGRNTVIIKNVIFCEALSTYENNVLHRVEGKNEIYFYVDSLNLVYNNIYEYLGFADKEEYEKYES